jgi:hypothetical protein
VKIIFRSRSLRRDPPARSFRTFPIKGETSTVEIETRIENHQNKTIHLAAAETWRPK